MQPRQWTIDAFASGPFKGNPACVLEPLEAWPDDVLMHAIAAENNQAETAFLLKTPDPARFGLRWCTPAIEVDLCGHATLASGHALIAELGLEAPLVTFDTRSGPLTVERRGDGYRMDFPAQPPTPIADLPGLGKALGAEPREVWATSFFVVAMLAGESAVRGLAPDIVALKAIASQAANRGNVAVTALADAGAPFDVVSRFFAPGSGIAEDPATGSLHCVLTPLYAARLGRDRLRCHQAYPGRGGDLECELAGDRVRLDGGAATYCESRLRIDL
jgi:PhzF family phenazine biosynthesis protein